MPKLKSRAAAAALILVFLGVNLAACVPASPIPEPPQANEPVFIQASLTREDDPSVSGDALVQLAQSNQDFAFDLYQALQTEPGNLFYSPYSISIALAMTYAGARGETESQMAQTLRFTLPQEELHPAFNALDQALRSQGEVNDDPDERFILNIANALWGQTGYDFLPAFLDTLARNYGAGMHLLDFSSAPEASRQTINEWVSDQTEKKIQDLLAQGAITPETRLVLTNAIYFNALWLFEFSESQTRAADFHLLEGDTVTVEMMHQMGLFAYARGEGYQAVELPYRGSKMSMLVILPDEGFFESFERSLDGARIRQILAELSHTGMTLDMPRFEYESSLSLAEVLMVMGMPAAFGPDADFSGIDGGRSLFISDVVHKAFVSVDEEGTEAAAATAVVMPTGAPLSEIELTLDRPFIFTIMDRASGAILFVGRVLDPS
jgi:serpin B